MRENTVVKGFLIFGIVFVLWLSTFFVKFLVNERQDYRQNVIEEYAKTWASSQTILGPQLFINTEGDKFMSRLPDTLDINVNVETSERHKGIYKIPVYTADISYSGKFIFDKNDAFYKDFHRYNVLLGLFIKDFKGLTSDIVLTVNGKKYNVKKVNNLDRILAATVPLDDTMNFKLEFKLKGLDELSLQTTGAYTKIKMKSNWKAPSFSGDFLPEKYDITNDGFTATWKVYEFNRSLPMSYGFKDYYPTNRISSFKQDDLISVKFIATNSTYRKTDRTIKYSFMVLALTFLVFFFIEKMKGVRIHLVQYFLIGAAMVVFYTLLLGLSENISFNLAYWIATLMTVSLIAVYFGMILKSKSMGITVFAGLFILYAFIFVLLNLETYAMLAGSIGLFVIIAILMYFSLKIKWYKD